MSLPSNKRKADEVLNAATRLKTGHVFESINISGGCNILGDYYISQPSAFERLLGSLSYREMNARINDISDPCATNFDWAFASRDNNLNSIVPECKFAGWLKSSHSIFWVSGKPGSGKSTLMKYLAGHSETRHLLDTGRSDTSSCTILSHYFWMSGSAVQYNMKGCLSNLCFQLIQIQKARVENSVGYTSPIDPASGLPVYLQTHLATLSRKQFLEDWSSQELEKLVFVLLSASSGVTCIFLDGLDEYNRNKNTGEILSLVSRIARNPGVKICVSSRPEMPLEASLSKHPYLKLHDFTRGDIINLAQSRLTTATTEFGFNYIGQVSVRSLSHEIASGAEGVFIWALLAVEDTIDGMHLTDNITSLLQNLKKIPRALDDCYNMMLARARNKNGPIEEWVQALFAVPINTWIHLGPMYLSLGALQTSRDFAKMASYTVAQWLLDSEYLRKQIYAQSAGLLQTDSWPSSMDLEELICKYREVKLGRLLTILVPGLSTVTEPTHKDLTDLNMPSIEDSFRELEYPLGDHSYGCLNAIFQPIHRTVHQFFLNRVPEQRNSSRDAPSLELLGRSILLPILWQLKFFQKYPMTSTISMISINLQNLIQQSAAKLVRQDAKIDIGPILVVLDEFLYHITHNARLRDAQGRQWSIRMFTQQNCELDMAGYLYYLGFDLMTKPASFITCNASPYYKGYLSTCVLSRHDVYLPELVDASHLQNISSLILSVKNYGTDILTPQIDTYGSSIEILSPSSRWLLWLLKTLTDDGSGIKNLEGVLRDFDAWLASPNMNCSRGNQAAIHSTLISPPTTYVETGITLTIRSHLSIQETILHMPASSLKRLTPDLFEVRRTKQKHHLLPLCEYGLIIDDEQSDFELVNQTSCREALLNRALKTGDLDRIYFSCRSVYVGACRPSSRTPTDTLWRAPEMTFTPTGNDWYLKGSLLEFHQQRESGILHVSEEFREWERSAGLTPDYEKMSD